MVNGWQVVDGHADILYRMGKEALSFDDANSPLQQGALRLERSGVDVQVFATFIEPHLTPCEQLYRVFASLYRFRREIEAQGVWKAVTSVAEMDERLRQEGKCAFLSLEGADALNGEIAVLDALFRAGVRWLGLTWNGANCLADGVGEERGAGLTEFGKEVIVEMQRLGMVVDVSHLAWRGVEDVLQRSNRPVVASHSNAHAVFPHRRNLPDELLQGIAASGGTVGMTFVPQFVGYRDHLAVDDLLPHIEHLLRVAGVDGVAFGSDFDGIEETLVDLRSGEDYPQFVDRLIKEFGEQTARKMAGENLLRVLRTTLP